MSDDHAQPGPPGLKDYGLLGILAAIWGGSFVFIKLAVETVPPASVAAGRLSIAAVLLLAVTLVMRRDLPRDPKAWLFMGGVAVMGNAIPFTLIGWGEEEVDSGLAAILMAVNPLATLILAHVCYRDEAMTLRKFLGVLVGFSGIIVLIGPEKLGNLGDETLRQLAIAAAACGYAVAAMMNKQLSGLSFRGVSAGVMLLSSAIMVPYALVVDRPWTLDISAVSGWSVVILGIFPTAIANLMLLMIIRRQGASFLSLINYLVPIFGLAWGMIFLGERPEMSALFALILILGGLAMARPPKGARTIVSPRGGAPTIRPLPIRRKDADDS